MNANPKTTESSAEQTAEPPQFELTTSRQFPNFLAEQQVNLALTTYQAGKLFLLGLKPDGLVSVFERTLERSMCLRATASCRFGNLNSSPNWQQKTAAI